MVLGIASRRAVQPGAGGADYNRNACTWCRAFSVTLTIRRFSLNAAHVACLSSKDLAPEEIDGNLGAALCWNETFRSEHLIPGKAGWRPARHPR